MITLVKPNLDVLDAVMAIIQIAKRDATIYCEHYVSDFERGYHLIHHKSWGESNKIPQLPPPIAYTRLLKPSARAVSFTCGTSGYSIIIYYGLANQFNPQNFGPGCVVNSIYFNRKQYQEVADFILNYLLGSE